LPVFKKYLTAINATTIKTTIKNIENIKPKGIDIVDCAFLFLKTPLFIK
jgi:hypothetical protein